MTQTATLTLTDFLLARIAEDEEAAKAAAPWTTGSRDERQPLDWRIHMRHWSPARVLAECETKRRIVELHEIVTADYAGQWWTDPAPLGTYVHTGCSHCTSCGVDGESYIDDGPCSTLRLLAQPYADHPDFREEWRV